eukprot:scaffold24490_cov101-Isochrysis_galbana.AAC.2
MAVSTTVMESLSGSMKSSALAIEMKTSSLMRSGMPYLGAAGGCIWGYGNLLVCRTLGGAGAFGDMETSW